MMGPGGPMDGPMDPGGPMNKMDGNMMGRPSGPMVPHMD